MVVRNVLLDKVKVFRVGEEIEDAREVWNSVVDELLQVLFDC